MLSDILFDTINEMLEVTSKHYGIETLNKLEPIILAMKQLQSELDRSGVEPPEWTDLVDRLFEAEYKNKIEKIRRKVSGQVFYDDQGLENELRTDLEKMRQMITVFT